MQRSRSSAIQKLGGVVVGMRVVRMEVRGLITDDDGLFVTIEWRSDGTLTTTRWPKARIWQMVTRDDAG